MSEKQFKFDKFIKDIVKREDNSREKLKEYVEGQEELPQREYNRRYREKWQNAIRWRKNK
jgi:hypothetical protein